MSHTTFCAVIFSVLIMSSSILTHIILGRSAASVLKSDYITSDNFRQQDLSPELYLKLTTSDTYTLNWSDVLTTSMLNSNFHPKSLSFDNTFFLQYKKSDYLNLRRHYEAIWADPQYFPVASDDINFENGWMDARTYGGKRRHEGIDLFGPVTISGYYPIISITDGVVEQKGWLPLGGYRIGIRSTSGGYFYYAHLASYEKELAPGDTVNAGDILGFMGNTGYGEEGTVGMFPVHLHLGIYINTPDGQEISVNPYRILQCLRKKIRKCTYY